MRPTRFYQTAVWLPLLLPAAALLPVWLFGQPRSDVLGAVVGTLYFSMWYGGIPYLILALWATFRLRTQSERGARRLALLMPIYLLPLCFAYSLVTGALTGDVSSGFWFGLIALLYVLPIGYAYVGLTFAFRVLAGNRVVEN